MATNPYTNKVEYNGDTLIDISDTTATSDKVQTGYKIYGADGSPIYGTATQGVGITLTDTTDVGGGTIRAITGTPISPYSPLGQNLELIETNVIPSIKLSDTNYEAQISATSAKSIRAAATVKTFTIDSENYEYVSEWNMKIKYIMPDGTVYAKGYPDIYASTRVTYYTRRPTNITTLRNNDFNTNTSTWTLAMTTIYSYWSSASAQTFTTSGYGVYNYSSGDTLSGTTATIKTPNIYLGAANSSYFAAAARSSVDLDNTVIELTNRFYRLARPTSLITNLLHTTVDAWQSLYNS